MQTTLGRLGLLALVITLVPGCVIRINADEDHHGSYSKVFGGIDIDRHQHVGDLDSVNGSITLRDDSHAERVETVNGSIRAHDDVGAYSLETTNGSIRAGDNLNIEDSIRTVNGRIEVSEGSVIGHDLETVNGDIDIERTEVRGNVTTVNGDIRIERASVVRGDVIFEEHRHRRHSSDRPVLHISSDSRIEGNLELRQEVRLKIEDGAYIGSIVRYDDR
ncbi:MAG: hypothetical protein KDI19_08610 [Pseudomonadales bacterium]|nr:hypothetical protein [Pseudomonadales bacterium]